MPENGVFSLMGYVLLIFTLNFRAIGDSYRNVKKLYRERYGGFTSVAMVSLFGPDASRLVVRIETILRAESGDIKEFVNSLASGFNLVGVAGAIVTQVAVIGVTNDLENNFSWTVSACYVIGLVSGAFSVYFACVVHPAFTGLDDLDSIKKWLAQPGHSSGQVGFIDEPKTPYASAYAVMMILAPARLLNIAISSLVVGFGIHLGLVYTKYNAPNVESFDAIAVLIAYICTGIYAFGIYFLPQGLKDLEMRDESAANDTARGLRAHQPSRTSTELFPNRGSMASQQIPEMISSTSSVHGQSPKPVVEANKPQRHHKQTGWMIRGDSKDSHGDSTVNVTPLDGVDRQQQDNLDSMLRELITIQDQCTDITRRLLDWQQHHTPTTHIN